ncbi:uncharacterized protein LOC127968053 isoform X1 [Carassius gibelio]|uniref:uncharacterized protein LOC127968053 isoform X1 n=2 Tax=Carassius gibelio TaxID=101364 RepID=UPI002277B184|nr:uncharacterized protein LOC127968053 isoform X1 [Carassius gibelio]XP_052424887.1 uncharacterized protein LOC127968053 isoform X1 [Carassius gibelio]
MSALEVYPLKKKKNDKVVSLDRQWGQSVKKSRNVGRVIDSARIAVWKLEAVGYKPILFIGKQNKASNKWVADVITHLHPTPVTKMFLEKMQRAYEFILTKSTSTAQQPDSDIPTAEQHNSPSEEQCNGSILEPESLAVEQPELESLAVEQPELESLAVEQPEPESLAVEQPEPESLAVEQPEPESLAVEQPELESLAVEQPMKPTKESETLFILNLVPLSSQYSSTSLSPPSSTTFPAGLPSESSPPPPPLPCSKLLRQRKKRTKTSVCSAAPSATSVSLPSLIPTDLSFPQSCPPPAASSISQSLRQEGPCVKKRRKGCRKCSRQKIFLFDKIVGERINEGKAELKVHWLPCTVCGKTWDDTWEPASEFQHFLPESTNPNQLSP